MLRDLRKVIAVAEDKAVRVQKSRSTLVRKDFFLHGVDPQKLTACVRTRATLNLKKVSRTLQKTISQGGYVQKPLFSNPYALTTNALGKQKGCRKTKELVRLYLLQLRRKPFRPVVRIDDERQ